MTTCTCTMYVVRISNDNLSTSVIAFMFFSDVISQPKRRIMKSKLPASPVA